LEDNVCQREAACRLLEIGTEQGRPVEEIGLTSRVLEVFRSADSAPALVPVGDRIVVLSARRDRTDVESLT
jgi:two-component system, CitB family, sensor kinase